MSQKIFFRPHHFLCALCFQGNGYSPQFIANFSELMQLLNSENGDDKEIEVVDETDSICSPCPHRREKSCTSQEKILKLDKGHAQVLGIKAGEKITWGEAKKRISECMTMENFHQVCAPCDWKKLGICEGVLKNPPAVQKAHGDPL